MPRKNNEATMQSVVNDYIYLADQLKSCDFKNYKGCDKVIEFNENLAALINTSYLLNNKTFNVKNFNEGLAEELKIKYENPAENSKNYNTMKLMDENLKEYILNNFDKICNKELTEKIDTLDTIVNGLYGVGIGYAVIALTVPLTAPVTGALAAACFLLASTLKLAFRIGLSQKFNDLCKTVSSCFSFDQSDIHESNSSSPSSFFYNAYQSIKESFCSFSPSS